MSTNTNKQLIYSGLLFTVILFLWPVFMGISQPEGGQDEHFNWILQNLPMFRVQYFFAFLISPAIVYMMIVQWKKLGGMISISTIFGLVFLTAYVVLNSISYASQFIPLPDFIRSGMTEQAGVWYFLSPVSLSYFLNQMGYCFWGLGAIAVFSSVYSIKSLPGFIAIIYLVSALLSIIAFFGLIIENDRINSLTMAGGLVLLPVGIMTIIWGIRENKRQLSPARE